MFGVTPKESDSIINKYKSNQEKYLPLIKQILKSSDVSTRAVRNSIYILALLKDKNLYNEVINVGYKDSSQMQEIKSFYLVRVNYNREKNLNYLTSRLDELIKEPFDSHLITFLAFIDDVDLSLKYLDKLTVKGDGAVGELIWWTINYLYYMNKNNSKKADKIKNSYSYKVLGNI